MKSIVFNCLRLSIFQYILLIVFFLYFSSCKKDLFITSQNAQISTSVDSLKYDTVFTSIGSVTQSFKINNLNTQKLLLSKVKLMNGNNSAFKININGIVGNEARNIEVAANDSIYVFVTVNINPGNVDLPFIVKDSIMIMYNGNSHFVQLEAFGQKAHFFRNQIIKGNVSWTNNLPYIILGSIRIDTSATLTIESGSKIYLHADAPFITDGTLIINGTKPAPVNVTGDRIDEGYKNLPASWPGIYFRGTSKNNILKYAVIKNAYQAVVVEKPSVNSNAKLTLHQCIIDNAYDVGLLCINTSVDIDNSLITNCGTNVSVAYGGNYNIINCTIASYSNNNIVHKNPVLLINNFTSAYGGNLTTDIKCTLRNCIFWSNNGSVDNEIRVSKEGINTFNVIFDHCLYKAKEDPLNSIFIEVIKNLDPQFDNIDITKQLYNFHITGVNAPGINNGFNGTGFAKDLDDNNRSIGITDIGCYEKQ